MANFQISIIIIAITLCGVTGNQQLVWALGGFVAVVGFFKPFYLAIRSDGRMGLEEFVVEFDLLLTGIIGIVLGSVVRWITSLNF